MPVKIKGNEYSTVAERLNAIHDDYDYVSINTKIVDEIQEHISIKAVVRVHGDNFEQTYSGHAREYFEFRNKNSVNYAFALENAETSANSQISKDKNQLLKVLEDARQQADISISQLKNESKSLFGTDDIRALSDVQLKRVANTITAK